MTPHIILDFEPTVEEETVCKPPTALELAIVCTYTSNNPRNRRRLGRHRAPLGNSCKNIRIELFVLIRRASSASTRSRAFRNICCASDGRGSAQQRRGLGPQVPNCVEHLQDSLPEYMGQERQTSAHDAHTRLYIGPDGGFENGFWGNLSVG